VSLTVQQNGPTLSTGPTRAPEMEPRHTDRDQSRQRDSNCPTALLFHLPPTPRSPSASSLPSFHRAEPPDLPSTDSHGGLHQARGLTHVPQAGASLLLSLLERRPPSGFPPVYHFGFPLAWRDPALVLRFSWACVVGSPRARGCL
jgi:hypothetical protein